MFDPKSRTHVCTCFTNDGLSCALPMIIVRYKYTVYHYFLFSFYLPVYNRIENFLYFSITPDLFLIALYNYILLLCVHRWYEIQMIISIIHDVIRMYTDCMIATQIGNTICHREESRLSILNGILNAHKNSYIGASQVMYASSGTQFHDIPGSWCTFN